MGCSMSTSEDSGRSSYLDLLIAVLSQHEKNMDRIIEKMEKLSEDLTKTGKVKMISEKTGVVIKEVDTSLPSPDTLVYMKIRLNRPLNEILKILEFLKD